MAIHTTGLDDSVLYNDDFEDRDVHERSLNGVDRGASLRAHKTLPRRKDLMNDSGSLRKRYTISGEHVPPPPLEDEDVDGGAIAGKKSATQVLPPTPPNAIPEVDDQPGALSPVTPPPRKSPPTPDNTPPRQFLGTQPSFTSTRAESFKTAREDVFSDDDSDAPPQLPPHHPSRSPSTPIPIRAHARLAPSPLIQSDSRDDVPLYEAQPYPDQPDKERDLERTPVLYRKPSSSLDAMDRHEEEQAFDADESELTTDDTPRLVAGTPADDLLALNDYHESPAAHAPEPPNQIPNRFEDEEDEKEPLPRRGASLRDRLAAVQRARSPSTEQFGAEIGWPDWREATSGSKRASGMSMASMVEAYVLETPPKRQQTLRHRGKNNSLRVASSPFPTTNRDSWSSPESAHRLSHKKARLSNQNRWSYGSEVSRSFSLASSGVLPKTEIITVAVIPERRSSLGSTPSSKHQSGALSSGTGSDHYPPNAYFSRDHGLESPYRRRSSGDATPDGSARGRELSQPPEIPVRSSSLSAPTSRHNSKPNSRANSIRSSSDHFRSRRIAAEKDLRKTLDRMESERLGPKLRDLAAQEAGTPTRAAGETGLRTPPPEPGSEQWASLRPPSLLDTPFSQPSGVSTSPGPVETGEARAINFFPHNNNSVQLIDKHPLVAETNAVQEAQRQLSREGPMTPSTTTQPPLSDSPLRNPRPPPQPPKVTVAAPAPTAAASAGDRPQGSGPGSARRPSIQKRRFSESFVKSITRNLSLKNARNRKADQKLDEKLHPFWRPRGFWDGMSESDDEGDEDGAATERGLASENHNSLGIPQERTVVNGPLSLVRKFSARRQTPARTFSANGTAIAKIPSYTSLSRLRASRKMYKIPGLRVHFQFVGLKDLQERMLLAKQRKDDERRERRRDELRKSIGANVISQGDSRFPATLGPLVR